MASGKHVQQPSAGSQPDGHSQALGTQDSKARLEITLSQRR